MLLLVDCNNFFVSCERVKNPKLQNVPVVVLSGNNGIILARSQCAKALGIPMGAPRFQCEDIIRKYSVVTLTCNFSLYSMLSKKVMETLSNFSPTSEVYSIDEAFLSMDKLSYDEAFLIQKTVMEKTGIPVSLGGGKTKTLAKAATYFAKKDPTLHGVYFIEEADLKRLPCEEVWGIGPHMAERLRKKSIYTAQDLVEKSDYFLAKELSVIGLRTALELRGQMTLRCQEKPEPHQSISTGRSFKKPLFTYEDIAQMLANYTADIALDLRKEGQLASTISVWLCTSFFGKGEKYANSASHHFCEPTAYTPTLIHEAKELLRTIYQEGYAYKKVGVLLSDLHHDGMVQQDLFQSTRDKAHRAKSDKEQAIMKIVDRVNENLGKDAIYVCSQDV